MAQPHSVNGSAEHAKTVRSNEKLERFAAALTALSREYGIGIAGEPWLFDMETDRDADDFSRTYQIDAEGRLIFD